MHAFREKEYSNEKDNSSAFADCDFACNLCLNARPGRWRRAFVVQTSDGLHGKIDRYPLTVWKEKAGLE